MATSWPLGARPDAERAAEVTTALATARVNRVAIAFCDHAGVERGQAWTEVTGIVVAERRPELHATWTVPFEVTGGPVGCSRRRGRRSTPQRRGRRSLGAPVRVRRDSVP